VEIKIMGYDVKGKIVLVTGANRGIGRAIVEGALKQGAAKVYAAVRSVASAVPLAEALGDRVVPLHIDLEDSKSIYDAAAKATDVQVVINNAGVLANATPLSSHAIESLTHEFNVNVIGLIHMAQAFAAVLKANGGGAFVQLNSVVSVKAFADFATYSASKAASYSITQSLRDVLGAQGTQVLSVHPGPIQTDMGKQAGLEAIAEPPSLVSDAIWQALKDGEFHAFPDSMARQIGAAYKSFAESVVEASMSEEPT
jgi:NAD(P)-dependent dehydrogenase (short-subunit alcohol dehydrogenase family)